MHAHNNCQQLQSICNKRALQKTNRQTDKPTIEKPRAGGNRTLDSSSADCTAELRRRFTAQVTAQLRWKWQPPCVFLASTIQNNPEHRCPRGVLRFPQLFEFSSRTFLVMFPPPGGFCVPSSGWRNGKDPGVWLLSRALGSLRAARNLSGGGGEWINSQLFPPQGAGLVWFDFSFSSLFPVFLVYSFVFFQFNWIIN